MARGVSVGVGFGVVVAMVACGSFGAEDPPGEPASEASDSGATGRVVEDADVSADAAVEDAGEDAAAPAAPEGMVFVRAPTPFFIDAREASVSSFEAIVKNNAWNTLQPRLPSACQGADKPDWGPRIACHEGPMKQGLTQDPDAPVNCVDWCDAAAYCIAQNKRLCGKIGGDPFPAVTDTAVEDNVVEPSLDEWTFACGGPEGQVFPYGNIRKSGMCNDNSSVLPSTSNMQCEGRVPGLFDMVGNLNEWEAACSSDGASAVCAVRGGAYRSGDANGCHAKHGNPLPPRLDRYDDVGIRCCADVP